ncbi:TPA: PDZ domain-containing protein [Shigella flexneri]|nr:PDZ domain-containing protein [Shigella flexneri]
MKKQTQLLSALALSAGLTLSASFQAVASILGQVADQAPLPSLAPMLEKVLPAVVSVRVEGTASQGQKIPEEFKKFFGDDLPDQPAQPFEGLGSGVIINASKGYVLTNNHVINQAQKISIQLNDGREFDAKLIGSDDQSDIAKAFNLDVQRGAFVSEVLPSSGSAKAGVKAGDIITSLNGKPLNSFAELRSRIATTEPGTKVKLGLLRNGKPLEVEVTLDTSTSSSASAEMITPALEGATLSDGQLKDGGKGIKIDEVVKGSPAAQAGLQKDDVIIGVNRDRVNSIAEMRKVLAAKPAIIALQIVRGNESIYLLMR